MKAIIKLTICWDCNKRFDTLDAGDLNQTFDRQDECDICKKDLDIDGAAYDIELSVKSAIIMLTRMALKIKGE